MKIIRIASCKVPWVYCLFWFDLWRARLHFLRKKEKKKAVSLGKWTNERLNEWHRITQQTVCLEKRNWITRGRGEVGDHIWGFKGAGRGEFFCVHAPARASTWRIMCSTMRECVRCVREIEDQWKYCVHHKHILKYRIHIKGCC